MNKKYEYGDLVFIDKYSGTRLSGQLLMIANENYTRGTKDILFYNLFKNNAKVLIKQEVLEILEDKKMIHVLNKEQLSSILNNRTRSFLTEPTPQEKYEEDLEEEEKPCGEVPSDTGWLEGVTMFAEKNEFLLFMKKFYDSDEDFDKFKKIRIVRNGETTLATVVGYWFSGTEVSVSLENFGQYNRWSMPIDEFKNLHDAGKITFYKEN